MKSIVVAGLALLVVASAAAQTAVPVDPKKLETQAVPTAPTKKDDGKKKKADEIGKIEGMEIARGTGFLGVQIANGVFKLTAYDGKKKPVAADFTRVGLRWNPQNVKGPEHAMLFPSGGLGVFSSDKIVKPPHQFRLFITLITGEGDAAPVENLSIDFRG